MPKNDRDADDLQERLGSFSGACEWPGRNNRFQGIRNRSNRVRLPERYDPRVMLHEHLAETGQSIAELYRDSPIIREVLSRQQLYRWARADSDISGTALTVILAEFGRLKPLSQKEETRAIGVLRTTRVNARISSAFSVAVTWFSMSAVVRLTISSSSSSVG